MQATEPHIALDRHVIKTLLYYDIFNYPLKRNEVYRFLGMNSITELDVEAALNQLASDGIIFRFGNFYTVQQNESLVSRRLKGNRQADEFLSIASKRASFIASFPFVKGVMASGSLSKNYMDEHCDLDFFIVTTPGRLWICRTLLVLYKRVFLGNSHKFFCVNYFLDEDHLEIEEKNLFTATELSTVIPLYGRACYEQLQAKNRNWLIRFFPNFKPLHASHLPDANPSLLKKAFEGALNVFFSNWFERRLMQLTLNRWERLYRKQYSDRDFSIAFKTKAYASKNHPRNFQRTIMDLYGRKLRDFSLKFDLGADD